MISRVAKYRTCTNKSLVLPTGLSLGATEDALNVFMGTGVIRPLEEGPYTFGSKLFESWASQQQAY